MPQILKLVFVLSYFLRTDAVDSTDRVPFSCKIKSIKCVVEDPSVAKLNFCYIKPVSRTVSTINAAAQLLQDFVAPSDIIVSVQYRFGLIYREILRHRFDFCKLWKNDVFNSDNALENVVYYAINESLPSFFHHGCPYVKGTYNITNVTTSIDSVAVNQILPSGMYKLAVNVSSKGKLWFYGWGTGEVKTPILNW